jgi:hypothetical protein
MWKKIPLIHEEPIFITIFALPAHGLVEVRGEQITV